MSVRARQSPDGDTASRVMGLSLEANDLLNQLTPSNRAKFDALLDIHFGKQGRFLQAADNQLSRFKGELLQLTDQQPSSSPTVPSLGADPDTLPADEAQVSPVNQIYSPISPAQSRGDPFSGTVSRFAPLHLEYGPPCSASADRNASTRCMSAAAADLPTL